ncbi:MAG: GNAT family N-acetyltransferase [Oscillospiraceae bacterium]|nr:GNAT family N-acetyltransferase [Oscillospiraceae bacterium]
MENLSENSNALSYKAKPFSELTAAEIYEILKARSRVFQFEQNIRYLDEDDVDYDCLHCFFEENGQVAAYLRAYLEDGRIKLGRVLTVARGKGLGKRLAELSVQSAREHFGALPITVDAQKHAEGFYKKLGFVTTSGEFLEEGIVHVKMELKQL